MCSSDHRLDRYVLSFLSDIYHISVMEVSPHQLGCGCSRPRMYAMLLLKSRLQWHPAIESDPRGAFFALFTHDSEITPPRAFVHAPARVVAEYVTKLAKKRRMAPRKRSGQPWSWYQVATPAERARVKCYDRRIVRAGHV